ncbi:MAG: NADH-dependent [FeFe] hydrogenase, group A6 [Candidatus Woesearchaeota archaeon]
MKNKKIKFKINDIDVEGNEGDKIIDVAKKFNIRIPHLCYHPRLESVGACRLCIVEVEGISKPVTSCSTPIREGMVVRTHTPRILKDRKTNLQLILANHDYSCLTCSHNLKCKLQKYAEEYGIEKIPFEGEKRISVPDFSSTSIVRDNSKCILCGRCVRMCQDVQTVNAIGFENRGFYTTVTTPFNVPMNNSSCVNCGQCVIVCPTGALREKTNLDEVIEILNSGKYVIAQTAPSIRASLGECFGMEAGVAVTGKMVSALKQIGFKKVFDTNFGADLTIIEEATEFIKRFKSKKNLPLISTCCPAWIKFGEQFFYEELEHMSTCKSPQAMTSSLVKTYFAKKMKIKPEDIVMVDIMPCTAKKFEITRSELKHDTDFVLTTVELAKLIKQFSVDFENLKDSNFDNPMGESTGASDIFGRTGGVMEAALRTAADFITGKDNSDIEFKQIRGLKTLKEFEFKIGKETIKAAAVHTLGEARKIMEQIQAGTCPYHFIEIMACYGGCVGGGGQPRYEDDEVLNKRAEALNNEDRKKKLRKSHLNPSALKIYKDYIGEFGGKKAHELLHTKYIKRESM